MIVPAEHIDFYRQRTFCQLPELGLKSKEDAISFVNQRGFIFFWPIKEALLPNLWEAAAGKRPVADAHDDPGHVTWGWKDSLLGQRVWYYAKVLRKRATMISLEVAPYFYALSENYGSEDDYLTLYEQGRMPQEAKAIYEALLNEGVLDTIALRRITHMTNADSETRFNRALTDLQADFKILPVGVTDSGAWKYAFAYEVTSRHFPDLPEKAQFISEKTAQKKLALLFLQSVGVCQPRHLVRLFGWTAPKSLEILQSLVKEQQVLAGIEIELSPNHPTPDLLQKDAQEWYAWRGLVEGAPPRL